MRIAIDGHPLVPPRAGIGQYTYHLIKALARVEPAHDYVVMYPPLARSLRMREVPVFAEKCVRVVSEGRLRFLWFRVRRKLRRKLGMGPPVERSIGSFDVYHATNYVFTHAVKRARRVVTIHDMTLVLFPEWHPPARVSSMTHETTRSLGHMKCDVPSCESTSIAGILIERRRPSLGAFVPRQDVVGEWIALSAQRCTASNCRNPPSPLPLSALDGPFDVPL